MKLRRIANISYTWSNWCIQYICRNGILCPIVNGEPLSLCGRACFSEYIYTCTSGTDLHLRNHRPDNPDSSHFVVLRAANPRNSEIDNLPMTACGRAWSLGGGTCSYCPEQVPYLECPSGKHTVVDVSGNRNSMGVMVPGGQMFHLTEDWTVGYTQAHSASIPSGATLDGFAAFEGGGFFNLLDGARGWAACRREGKGFELKVRNGTNEGELEGCVGLNLVMEDYEDGFGAWQYT